MQKQKTTLCLLKEAIKPHGITLKKVGKFYKTEYRHIVVALAIQEKSRTYTILTAISTEREYFDKTAYDIAIDVTKHIHPGYNGIWVDGALLFLSPDYAADVDNLADAIKKNLDDFIEAFFFLEGNAYIADSSNPLGI